MIQIIRLLQALQRWLWRIEYSIAGASIEALMRVSQEFRDDFTQICCRVRFLLGQPTRKHRTMWLTHWRRRYGDETTDAIEAELKRQWKNRKEERVNG